MYDKLNEQQKSEYGGSIQVSKWTLKWVISFIPQYEQNPWRTNETYPFPIVECLSSVSQIEFLTNIIIGVWQDNECVILPDGYPFLLSVVTTVFLFCRHNWCSILHYRSKQVFIQFSCLKNDRIQSWIIRNPSTDIHFSFFDSWKYAQRMAHERGNSKLSTKRWRWITIPRINWSTFSLFFSDGKCNF